MPSITSLLRSLGNAGAIASAQRAIEVRDREDWLVAGLSRRIAAWDQAAISTTAGPASPAVHAA